MFDKKRLFKIVFISLILSLVLIRLIVFAADGIGSSEPSAVDSAALSASDQSSQSDSSTSSTSTPVYFFDNFAMYMIIIFGIFSFVAYLVVTYIVYKGQGFFGPWIFFSIIALLFLFSEFTLNNIVVHRRFVAGIMFLFFAAAVFRYWDAVEMGQ